MYNRPLSRMTIEEAIGHLSERANKDQQGGLAFARTKNRDQKGIARQAILDLFHPMRRPGYLRMITMPGVTWQFERLLLALRDPGWMYGRASFRRNTHFTSVESDRAIFLASAVQMPGVAAADNRQTVKTIKDYPFAQTGIKTQYAALFFANVDDFMKHSWPKESQWDAAWLDFTGPLTVERVAAIRDFYTKHIKETLIITALAARWNREAIKAIDRAGGHTQWIMDGLNSDIVHHIEYLDTAPMTQIAIRKRSPALNFWKW